MNLIYYYPKSDISLPATTAIARTLFKYLLKREKELPFEEIMLFVPTKSVEEVQEQFNDLEVITYKSLDRVSNSAIHIPIIPLIFPNNKSLFYLYALIKRRKLILNFHGDLRIEMRFKFKYEHHLDTFCIPSYIAWPYLLKSANKLIINSYLVSKLVQSKYRVKNEVVIPNAIDDFWFDRGNITNIVLDGDSTNLFYHGRLSSEKGVDLLIKGFSKAVRNSPNAKLYIAGNGLQQKYLENLCSKLEIKKKVVFLGHTRHEDIKSYLNNVNAAIYPSLFDAFSLAILEAFSSVNGPVYYSSFAGINDFVVRDGYDLNVFEPTVENISKIIKNVIDGNYDEQIVKKQKEFARRYTWDKVSTQYIKLYKEVVQL